MNRKQTFLWVISFHFLQSSTEGRTIEGHLIAENALSPRTKQHEYNMKLKFLLVHFSPKCFRSKNEISRESITHKYSVINSIISYISTQCPSNWHNLSFTLLQSLFTIEFYKKKWKKVKVAMIYHILIGRFQKLSTGHRPIGTLGSNLTVFLGCQ